METSPLLHKHAGKRKSWYSVAILCIVILGLHYIYAMEESAYNIVIVGGGPAGAVIAGLLSRNANVNVLLLEAGKAGQVDLGGKRLVGHTSYTPFDVPYFWSNVSRMEDVHWDIPGVLAAKILGGCGVHNAMLYVRALERDIVSWTENHPDWQWEDIVKVYNAAETFTGNESEYHGYHGPIMTDAPGFVEKDSSQFVDACLEYGVPFSSDFNAPNGRYGAGLYHFNIRNGVRDGAARAFLNSTVRKRDNLNIKLEATVQKILFDDKVANGLLVQQADGTTTEMRFKKNTKLVISAGAINTPKLLMLSGIGAKDQLIERGITPIHDLPGVGTNLQDHPVVILKYVNLFCSTLDLWSELNKYVNTNRGTLFGSAGISAGAFLIPPGCTVPEIQLTYFPRSFEPHESAEQTIGNNSEQFRYAEISVALMHPKGRNKIELNFTHPHESPLLLPEIPEHTVEHLSNEDLDKLEWGIRVARNITNMPALVNVLGREIQPGDPVQSSKDLRSWIRASILRNSHWVGTSRIGRAENGAVVDPNFNVHGLSNIKIADASVIPNIPNGNVHSTVVMVGFQAAKFIQREFET